MKTITQAMKYRQAKFEYSLKHGVTKAAICYKVNPNMFIGGAKDMTKRRSHKLIKPYTPRHNGNVERSHRKDNEYFYATHKFYSFDDFCNTSLTNLHLN